MRGISTKFTGDSYSAAEFNSSQVELENIVTSAGLTLDPAGGPDNNQIQLGQAAAAYACGGDVFGATGTVNDIVLAHTSLLKDPVAYVDKMRVTFKAAGANTGAVTVNVDSIGVKKVLRPLGDGTYVDLTAGAIIENAQTTFIYNTALESGAGAFEFVFYPTSTVQVVHRADFGVTGGSVTANVWHTRTINRIDVNHIGSDVSLASNQLTLPFGTYDFWLIFHGWEIAYTAAMIYNETLSAKAWPATSLRGLVYFSTGTDHQVNLSGSFTLAATSSLTVKTYSTSGNSKGEGEEIVSSGRVPASYLGETFENIYLDWLLVRRNHFGST